MSWMDKLKEGAKDLSESDFAKELAQRAREKAEAGLNEILGGKKREGEQLISDAAKDAEAVQDSGEATTGNTSGETTDDEKSAESK